MPARESVDTSPDPAAVLSGSSVDSYGWDWSATTHEGSAGVVDELCAALGAETVTIGKGLQGWSQSVQAFDAGGYKVGAVFFGGGRDDVHVVSTSHQADDARRAVVGIGQARTARVDTRVDTLLPFEDLWSLASGIAGPRTKLAYWEGSLGDGTQTGRTLYVGAPTSMVRVRIYEKWLESPGLYVDGTNRVEVQLRPPSRAKEDVSSWGPEETFCASKLTRRLANELELEVARPGTLQKSKGTPDLERTLEAMGEQYGKAFRKWLTLSGGDLGRVLAYLEGEGPTEGHQDLRAPEARGHASDSAKRVIERLGLHQLEQ